MTTKNVLDDFHVELPGAEQITRRHNNGFDIGFCQTQVLVRFPNGYGASIISYDPPYEVMSHGVELAVLHYLPGSKMTSFKLVYDTPIGDIVGYLTPAETIALLRKIMSFPEREILDKAQVSDENEGTAEDRVLPGTE